MDLRIARDEYITALSRGKREYRELTAAGKDPHPAVLDEILGEQSGYTAQNLGVVDIPSKRIVGTKSAGRITAFTPSFRPLLNTESEFAQKWYALCRDHLGDIGIREPILCYEYLGEFYVQEGNKRVSVLRHFDAARIPGTVIRLVPPLSDDPRVKAYYEFMNFYRVTKLYTIQFRRPGDYDKLLAYLGRDLDQIWTEKDRRTFNSYYQYFQEAFDRVSDGLEDILTEEALLLWLRIHSFGELGKLSSARLEDSLEALWPDVVSSIHKSQVMTDTVQAPESKPNLLSRIISSVPDHVNVAFVHQLDLDSAWLMAHEDGRKHLEETFGDAVTARSYFNANTPENMADRLEQAVADGAQVVFTTSPKLSRATLKFAVKYPKVQFYNCSVDQPYSSVRTYYGRIYEAKFITGAIAGAMAQNDRIGYIASNPIFGVPASINAFALGAQMTNPRAQIELRWSCCAGTHQADFFRDGIRVISNRDVPTQNRAYLEFCNYGTYLMDDRGSLVPLASPVWVWGKFYEYVVRNLLYGGKSEDRSTPNAVNYWLGMDSGVIGIELASRVPEGISSLASMLSKGIASRMLNPFARKIVAQDGSIKNDGTQIFTADELLHMDWLCDNVQGYIPGFEEILPMSQSIVRELGIYRDSIPAVKEKR